MRMLTSYWPTRSLASDFFGEMDRVFDEVLKAPVAAYDERSFQPACEITESEEHYAMSVDLPGMRKEDIKVEMNGDVLTISGERKKETTSRQERVQRYEKAYGFFKRSFTLPTSIAADRIEAHYENGVLELCLPKTQLAKPRQINVQSGSGGLFNRFLGSKKVSADQKDDEAKVS